MLEDAKILGKDIMLHNTHHLIVVHCVDWFGLLCSGYNWFGRVGTNHMLPLTILPLTRWMSDCTLYN